MSFFEAIEACLTKYAVFEGRAPRAEYWWFVLFTTAVESILAHVIPLLGDLVGLVFLLPIWAVGVRRLHDIDRSGWWLLLPLPALLITLICGTAAYATGTDAFAGIIVPFALVTLGFYLVILFWNCQRGTIGPNRFGPDPFAPVTLVP
jgi:uncharacterized membrane protein YhaH (DUF805 family)